ncbi:MAG: ABC transporter permease [Candidatus Altiarchaeota archaeon]|nr:ABC transporter permease [Candidatus Altiarchaeota archaeon]
MIADYFVFAVKGIANRKLRSWLTLIGIFIGMMAVVALVSLGQGLQDVVNEQFEKVGGNRIIITPGGGSGGIVAMASSTMSSAKLTDDDVETVRSVRGVDKAIGLYATSLLADFKGEKKFLMVFCSPTDSESVNFYKTLDYMIVEDGSYLNPSDKFKVTVGRTLATDYFKYPIKRGNKISAEGYDFEVVLT